ncbi:SDR family NAD(P)-dependent oxidoreductase [Nocardia bovistercoris]|uniref:SDR family NAD(P)-dependent oxidoreductase n=1 Tax=Nocardia bovistercoris TaxID=2785916 RepID=A0A931I985_9NOCA|nr:SDR family NAD(P)-dependent oxidoreductase [Nocardia bovistercoris]MBH0776416.1 SDR family NAD(P)-dependent oxidoreductase [Nocardia bovistercoris]
MRTYVITGGTDGIGKGLGLRLLARGDRVFAVASGAEKGAAFLRDAEAIDAGERAHFLRADLSTLAGMRAVPQRVGEHSDTVDGLVFGAQRFRPRREETVDGFEFTFALGYLSRYVLGHAFVPALERAAAPVIMSVAGSGGLPGTIFWDDPQLRSGYRGMRAAMQASRCIDLLGVRFPHRHPGARTRYVLYNPLFTRTAMADPLPTVPRLISKAAATLFAQPVSEAVVPILRLVDEPPAEAVSAFRRRTPIPLTGRNFDPESASRLDALTATLLGEPRV